MEVHKRILGIIFIISGLLQILMVGALAMLFTFIFPMIAGGDTLIDGKWRIEKAIPIIRAMAISIFVLFSIPTIISGWALISHKKWGFLLALVMGFFKLFLLPVGTLIGIYTFWVFVEDQRTSKIANQ